MNLNRNDKRNLREIIEEHLVNVAEDVKIKLDKNLLEELIFEKINDENGKTMKMVIWSGSFLSKIDLSEVSFENVLFDLDTIYEGMREPVDIEVILNNTNIVIDFKKSYDYLDHGYVIINHFKLANVNLSNSNGDCIDGIYYCDLSNSAIKLQDLEKLNVSSSDLSGIDLSDREVDYNLFNEWENNYFEDTDLSNTGLKIKYTEKKDVDFKIISEAKRLMELTDISFENMTSQEIEEEKQLSAKKEVIDYMKYDEITKTIGKLIKQGKLNGCIINGKKINITKEKEEESFKEFTEYEKFRNNIFSEVICSIESHVSKHK